MDRSMLKTFETLKDALMKSPTLAYPDTNQSYTLFAGTSKYAWSALLTEEHTTVTGSKTLSHQHPFTYVSGLFNGS